ncbi:hypothetical protein LJB91_03990, partial [Bacteroidales bacterium OttesenSCG-928-L03]|nr:hypothetical protein [Bacteroidales bacterium OttesenSCG-928-L03]
MANNDKKVLYPLLTSILGTLPIVTFLVCSPFTSYRTALIAAVITFAVYSLVDTLFLKHDLPRTLLLSALGFILLVGMSLMPAFS